MSQRKPDYSKTFYFEHDFFEPEWTNTLKIRADFRIYTFPSALTNLGGLGDNVLVHFFSHDDEFEKIAYSPAHYAQILKKAGIAGIVAPDFSFYDKFVSADAIQLSKRNHVSNVFQENGVPVIPLFRPSEFFSMPEQYGVNNDFQTLTDLCVATTQTTEDELDITQRAIEHFKNIKRVITVGAKYMAEMWLSQTVQTEEVRQRLLKSYKEDIQGFNAAWDETPKERSYELFPYASINRKRNGKAISESEDGTTKGEGAW